MLVLPRLRAIETRVHKRSTVSARILGSDLRPVQSCCQIGNVKQVSQPSEMNCTTSRIEVVTQYGDGLDDRG